MVNLFAALELYCPPDALEVLRLDERSLTVIEITYPVSSLWAVTIKQHLDAMLPFVL